MSSSKPIPKLLLSLPVLMAAILLVLYGMGLSIDPNKSASRLVGKILPSFSLPSLFDSKLFLESQQIKGPAIINIWASWCGACREEHQQLLRIARQEAIAVYGVNYQDDADSALAWLQQRGNPFTWVMFDGAAAAGLPLDVFSLPQTYVIDEFGVVRFRHIGLLTDSVWQNMRETLQLKAK